MSRTKLCIAAVLFGFGFWLEAIDIAGAQSNSTIAAEQSCVNAAKQNNNAAAVSACTQALSLAPNNATVAQILCAAQTAAANYSAAVASCTQAIALNAKAEAAYLDRCDANWNLGNLAAATPDCTQAITLDPNDINAYVDLGNIYLKQNNYSDAMTQYNKALAIAPNSAMAIADRGLANLGLGNKTSALADFRNALKIDPANTTAQIEMKKLGTAAGGTAAASTAAGGAAAGSDISVCNGFATRVYVAFADQNQGNFTAAGWWSVDPNKCESADFAFSGATLYYAADSDQFRQGNNTVSDHWGGGTSLYISSQKFNIDNAQLNRSGAKSENFSSIQLTPQQQANPVSIVFHFVPGNTKIDVTIKK